MEILSQSQIFDIATNPPGWLIFLVMAIPILGVIIVALFQDDGFYAFIGLMVGAFCLMILGLLYVPKKTPTGRYEYKVILDESYPATELYENYEVIGQDGKIWIIQDKKTED